MRFATILRMSGKNVFSHVLRLIVVLLLASVALGLLGTAVAAARFDHTAARWDSLYPYEYRYLLEEEGRVLSDAGAERLRALGRPFSFAAPNTQNIARSMTAFLDPEPDTAYGTTGALYTSPPYMIAADAAALAAAGGRVIGRLPERTDEIALCACQFQLFLVHGYYDNIAAPVTYDEQFRPVYDEAALYPVTDAESFVRQGRKILLQDPAASDISATLQATIVGVVELGACPYDHTAATHPADYHDAIYVSSAYFTALNAGRNVVAMVEKQARDSDIAYFSAVEAAGFMFGSEVLQELDAGAEQLDTMKQVFGYIGIGLAAFCIVLIYQFTSFIMESKRGEIGILRALGAGKRDIVILFLMQSLLLSLLQAAGGAVVMLALVPSVNAVVSSGVNAQIVFLRFSFVAFVIELAVSVVVTALSALLPIAKVAKMSPVDAIRRNEV